jgi:hypothetical protein
VSNLNVAVVPTQNDYIDIHVGDPAYIIFDIAGYFAP